MVIDPIPPGSPQIGGHVLAMSQIHSLLLTLKLGRLKMASLV